MGVLDWLASWTGVKVTLCAGLGGVVGAIITRVMLGNNVLSGILGCVGVASLMAFSVSAVGLLMYLNGEGMVKERK